MSLKPSHLYGALLVLTLAGHPFVASVAQVLATSATPISIFVRALTLVLSLLILALILMGGARLRALPYLLPFFVFWLAYLTRIYVETEHGAHHLSRSESDYWIWAVGACLIPASALLTCPLRKIPDGAFHASLLGLYGASCLTISLGSGMGVSSGGQEIDMGRLSINALNPISAGHLGLSLFLMCCWSMGRMHRVRFQARTLIELAGGTIGIYLLVASASRGPMLALLGVVAFYLFSQNIRRILKAAPLIALGLFVAVQLVLYIEEQGQFLALTRALNSFGGEDESVIGRQIAYSGAVAQFLADPLFGSSLEERLTRLYPHNIILEAFMTTGITGGVPFILLTMGALLGAFRLLKSGEKTGWVALIFIQYFIAAQFSGAVYTATTMWGFFGLMLANTGGIARQKTTSAFSTPYLRARGQY